MRYWLWCHFGWPKWRQCRDGDRFVEQRPLIASWTTERCRKHAGHWGRHVYRRQWI